MVSRRHLPYLYDNAPLFDHLRANLPHPYPRTPHEDVYIMGPYTPFDISKAIDIDLEDYQDADIDDDLFADLQETLRHQPYIDGPVFDPDVHDDLQDTLKDVRDDLHADPGVRAFIATDANIPTAQQLVDDATDDVDTPDEAAGDYLTPLDQSIEFALLADFVVFILDESGLNNGVSAEVGEILGELNLRGRNPDQPQKPRDRFLIFRSANVPSASLDESLYTYGVEMYEYDDYDDLLWKLRKRLDHVDERSRDSDYNFPVFYGDAITGYPDDEI